MYSYILYIIMYIISVSTGKLAWVLCGVNMWITLVYVSSLYLSLCEWTVKLDRMSLAACFVCLFAAAAEEGRDKDLQRDGGGGSARQEPETSRGQSLWLLPDK